MVAFPRPRVVVLLLFIMLVAAVVGVNAMRSGSTFVAKGSCAIADGVTACIDDPICNPPGCAGFTCVGNVCVSGSSCSTPATLALPDLQAASDSAGTSTSDNITNNTALTFEITGCTNDYTVRLYDAGVQIGSDATCSGTSVSIAVTPFSEGAHTLTAKQFTDAACLSTASSTLTVTVDTTAPTVTNFTSTYATPADGATTASVSANITLAFSEALAPGGAGAVVIYTSAGAQFQSILGSATSISSDTATISHNALAGSTAYYINIAATAFTDVAGNAYSGITTGDSTTWNFTTTSVCGDARRTGSEGCDDGGTTAGDGCSATCTVESGYTCSGGSSTTPDTCATTCGDGIEAGAEECDDGNATNTDACLNTCLDAECGDSVVRTGVEACDDGNAVNTDACTNACALASCGDGVKQSSENCDDGNAVTTDACLNTCIGSSCGDGFIQAGVDDCDDGNFAAGDGCTQCDVDSGYTCTGTPSSCTPTCGDGIVASVNECDDGNTINGDGCTSACVIEYCGDGIRNNSGKEECDYGSGNAPGGGCTPQCQSGGDDGTDPPDGPPDEPPPDGPPVDPCAGGGAASTASATEKVWKWISDAIGWGDPCDKTVTCVGPDCDTDECMQNPDGTWTCPPPNPVTTGFCFDAISGRNIKPDGTLVANYGEAAGPMLFATCLAFKDAGKHPVIFFGKSPEPKEDFKVGYKLNTEDLCYETDIVDNPQSSFLSGYSSTVPTSGGSPLLPCSGG